jgi:hypothetical protein
MGRGMKGRDGAETLPIDPRWEERTLPFDEVEEQERARRTAIEQGLPEVSEEPWR